jgi:outer membrane biosynthesis protein TonB
MAAKKKTKTKAKKAKQAKKTKKKTAARKPAGKAAARKPARKKVATKKRTKAKPKAKSKPKAKAAPKKSKPAAAAPTPTPETPPGERVGIVTHYFNHLSVAIVQIETGSLRVGELVHIKGHTSDFNQSVETMEIDHANVEEAHAGQTVGLRVNEHAREHDVVYKLPQ